MSHPAISLSAHRALFQLASAKWALAPIVSGQIADVPRDDDGDGDDDDEEPLYL